MERLTGGVSADVHRLEIAHPTDGVSSIVMRAHRADHQGCSADMEFSLLKSLYQAGLPVPEPLLVDTSKDIWSQAFLFMRFVHGSSDINSKQLHHCIDSMAYQLATIHSMSPETLPNLPARLDPLPEVFDYLPQEHEWSTLRAHLRSLTNTRYTQSGRLLHGDFWVENLLWRENAIVGVLDWEDAAIGDPLSDVAQASVELRYKFGKQGMQRFIDAYSIISPVDTDRLALWHVYVAAAAHKYMGGWGLEPRWEAHMRKEALASIKDAEAVLTQASQA